MASRAYRRAMMARDSRKEALRLQSEAQKRQQWGQGLSTALALAATGATGGAASPLVAAALAGGAKLGGTALGNYIAGDITGGQFHREARREARDKTETFGADTLSGAAFDAVTAGAGQYMKTAKGLKDAKKLIAASESAEALKALTGNPGAAVALAGMDKIDPKDLARARKIVEAGKWKGIGKYGLDFSDSFAKSSWDRLSPAIKKGSEYGQTALGTALGKFERSGVPPTVPGPGTPTGSFAQAKKTMMESRVPGVQDVSFQDRALGMEHIRRQRALIDDYQAQQRDLKFYSLGIDESFLDDPINVVDTPLQEFSDWNMPVKEAWQEEPMGGAGSRVQQTIQDQRNLLNTRLQRDLGRAYQQGQPRLMDDVVSQTYQSDFFNRPSQQHSYNIGGQSYFPEGWEDVMLEDVFNTSPASPPNNQRNWSMYDLYEGGMNERRR